MQEPPSISEHSPYDAQISPELVLVSSPEDARWAREQLPEPGAGRVQRRQEPDATGPLQVECDLDPIELHDATILFAAADAAVAAREARPRRVASLRLGRAASAAVAIAAVLVVAFPVAGLTPKVRPVLVESETSGAIAGPDAAADSPPTGPAGPASTAGSAGAVDAASTDRAHPGGRLPALRPQHHRALRQEEVPERTARRPPPVTAKAATPRHSSPSSVPAAATKRAVKEAPQVPRLPLLSWTNYPGARGYWVRVVVLGPKGDERIVLTRKTDVPGLQLPATLPDGAGGRRSFPSGSYRWYVWPDTGAHQGYDAPTAWGSFSVS
jgi:hypothetical protein